MNKIYKIKNNNIKKEMLIFLITDLHYDNPKDLKRFSFILEDIKRQKPDFLCFCGDLLDSANVSREDLFLDFLSRCAKETKTFVIIGNHDVMIHKKKTMYHKNELFFEKLSSIPNVTLLDDKIFEFENLRFIGVTLPFPYYYHYRENPNYLMKYINRTFSNSYDHEKMNILLAHSPLGLTHPTVRDQIHVLKNIDLILTGHTHNGMVPQKLEPMMKNSGIISPFKTIHPECIRGSYRFNDTDVIISGGITKLSKRSHLKCFNRFWNKEITKIYISPTE